MAGIRIPCSTFIIYHCILHSISTLTYLLPVHLSHRLHTTMMKLRSHFEDTTRTGISCMLLASVGAFLFVRFPPSSSCMQTCCVRLRLTWRFLTKGFDNGWWATLLGAQTFLRHYGSCHIADGVETCDLLTSQQSAGSAVQSAGMSSFSPYQDPARRSESPDVHS